MCCNKMSIDEISSISLSETPMSFACSQKQKLMMKRQASVGDIVEQKHVDEVFYSNDKDVDDEVDGVRNKPAMTLDERRNHLRRMQSMGSLCNTPVMYSLTTRVTSVARALEAMTNSNGNDKLTRSLSSKRSSGSLGRFCPYCEETGKSESDDSRELLNKLILRLHKQMEDMQATLELERSEVKVTNGYKDESIYDIWFPRKISELDMCANKVLTYGVALDADHPGFKDKQYRERRKYFVDIAYKFRHGDAIPRAEYTDEETTTWGRVFSQLLELYPKYACKEYLQNLQYLRDGGLYSADRIPQLEDVSKFLKESTGFQIRPVAGYLSSRDFLSGLAFRTFACTQYIRHSSDPFYTPEPDCCHELMGHVPMFADKSFAQFSQEIGLASLGASDDDIDKLASCYFFSIEFGLCRQNGQTKVYGAGLMSSIGELTYAMEGKSTIFPFSPEEAIKQECRITTFQDAYFVTSSFAEAKNQMREYAGKIERPFTVRYDPYTQSIEVLSSVEEMTSVIGGLKDDLEFLASALVKIQAIE